MAKKFRIAAIISYLFICIAGSMIAMPLFLILPLSIFDKDFFGWPFYSVIGFLLILFNYSNINVKDALLLNFTVFVLLLLSIIECLLNFDLHFFNFPMFYVPLSLFITLYLISLILEFIGIKKLNKINDL